MQFLQVSDIYLQEGDQKVLHNISFTQKQFQKIAIAGETGSGKSTLLQIIAGLVQPSSGSVYFAGNKVIGPQDQLIPGHPGVAYLSQQFELPAFLRVEQVLKYANKLSVREAKNLFKVCHIEHLLTRKTSQLSGGERQRIAMARLLLGAPRLFLLDEPFSNLDMGHKSILKQVIHDLGEKLGISLILVSHDPLDTLSWADKIMVMQGGKIIQKGSPEKIYNNPINSYAAGLFGNFNKITLAEAHSVLGNNLPTSKKRFLLIRPEQLKITSEVDTTINGSIQNLTYFGSYSEVTVAIQNVILKVRTERNDLKKGDSIYLNYSPENSWYI